MVTHYPHGPMFRVHLTKEIIRRGVIADSRLCMIAEAIRAARPEARSVMVDIQTIRFTDPEKNLRYCYLTPYSAAVALLQFDDGVPPPPFSFVLRNAHVSAAGRAAHRGTPKASSNLPKRRTMVSRKRGSDDLRLPRVVGGRRPPQLKTIRKFGIRAFAGASSNRLLKLAAAEASES